MKNLITLISFFLFLYPSVYAQVDKPVCGTTVNPEAYELLRQQAVDKNVLSARMQAATCTLKLQPHIVRRSNGTGGLSYGDLLTSVLQLNLAFDQTGIYFDMRVPRYINNDTYFNQLILDSSGESIMGNSTLVPDAVNVYYAPNAGVPYNGGVFFTNWSSFPFMKTLNNKNWTVMNNNFATDGETLPHEIGHYFNLLHTHHAGPVNNQYIDEEHISRDPNHSCYNADVAGDLVSDTPADHDLATWTGYAWYQNIDFNCNYIGNQYGSGCNLPYSPDTRNIMSYAYIDGVSIGCRINFTQGQSNRMIDAINNLRPELNVSCELLPIELLDFTAKKERNASLLQWTVIAQQIAGYEIQHSTDAQTWENLSFIEETNNTSSPSTYEYRHLRPEIGENYYRLKAIGTDESIETSQIVSLNFDKPLLGQSRIYPNPVALQKVNMDYIASSSEPINIMIYNLVGQAMLEEQQMVSAGFNQLQLDIGQLNQGIYFIKVVQGNESITLKLIKQ